MSHHSPFQSQAEPQVQSKSQAKSAVQSESQAQAKSAAQANVPAQRAAQRQPPLSDRAHDSLRRNNVFTQSLRELKQTRCLAFCALLVAINLTLDILGLTIKLPPDLRISFGFLCNATIGMLYGPSVGVLAGVCTDVLGYFVGNFTMGGYFPGFTITAMVGGLLWGLWLYPNRNTIGRVIGARASVTLLCNIGLNTLWLTLTGGKAMGVLLALRIPKNLILLPIETVLLYVFLRLFIKIYRRLPTGVYPSAGKKEER